MVAWAMAIIIVMIPMKASASIAMPILPYIPPESVEIFDMLNTIFGVTSPDIQDDYERLQAYFQLYQGALGLTWETFYTQFQEWRQEGATQHTLTIDSSMFDSIQTALEQALSDGYYYGTQYDLADNPTEWKTMLKDRFNIEMDIAKLEAIYNVRQTGSQVKKPSVLVWAIYDNGTKIKFDTIAYNVFWPVRYELQSGYYRPVYNGASLSCTYFEYNYSNGVVGTKITDGYGSMGIQGVTRQGNTYSSLGDNAQVVAQSSTIASAIQAQTVAPVTAGTESVGGNIVINLPNINIYPATTISDVTAQQEQLGVVPTTPDMTQQQIEDIIQQLQQAQVAQYGSTQEYQLHLIEYFPFCIPFDVGNLLTLFVAEPQAPVIQFMLPTGYDVENGVILTQYELDLSQFDTVALWCRRGMMLVFIVGLGFLTRSMILRG